ncbi:MAG: ATP-dependent zinc metalloprotease FtsH [Candidatus Marinimicrobia bacterium]|jgi:cell division protease FtsH|nr:ATP-dependent zinc metalloprotease FtsH [Candidatus Neomarinimicrobiota bacterium]
MIEKYFTKENDDNEKKKKIKFKSKNNQNFKKKDSDNKNSQKPEGFKDFDFKKFLKTPTIWIFLIIAVILLANMITSNNFNEVEISYTRFQSLVDDRMVLKGEIEGNRFHGKLAQSQTIIKNGKEYTFKDFIVTVPFFDSDMLKQWDEVGINYTFKEEEVGLKDILINILPWIILIGVWIFIMRRMQKSGGGGPNIFSFGKSPAKRFNPESSKTTFNDVAGCDEAKTELSEIIDFLKSPEKFQKLGGKIPHGAILLGPPGTGKTLLAKAAAGEAEVPFFSMSGADFVEMFVGVGASRVKGLFNEAQKSSPCIIFIDEIDAVGRQRGAGLGGGHDEREQTLNQLLVQMDGFDSDSSVIVVAATNRPDILDKALLRPGRFDRQIVVDIPDVRGREEILKIHTKNINVAKNVKLKTLAKGTPGLTGADLANIVNEAALLAARENREKVLNIDFEEAKDKVMMGTERRSMIISDTEKELTAYHETGHALVAIFSPEADPIHKVSIVPRGRALGVTHLLPEVEKHNYTKKYFISQLGVLLGGRSAEELIFNDVTNGAGSDLETATKLARQMVCEWGMSDKLGPLTFGKKDEEIFLGREFGSTVNYSEKTAKLIDNEITEIVTLAHKNAKDILSNNIELLHKIAKKLLKQEVLDGKELMAIIKKAGIDVEKSNN